jgi:hypothetical protein
MMSHGADGLRQVAEDAVLNANYLRVLLEDDLSLSFPGPCMHEVLFDDQFLRDTGVTTLDFAKALIDEGYHPMTMYFPLVVHGALLIEPTETESWPPPRDRAIRAGSMPLRSSPRAAGSTKPPRPASLSCAGAPDPHTAQRQNNAEILYRIVTRARLNVGRSSN